MIDVFRLFGKLDPFVSLFDHCCETGDMAGKLWDLKVIDNSIIARDHLCLLVALHDIGKCHPIFQKKGVGKVDYLDELCREGYIPTRSKSFRHELVTEAILLKKVESFSSPKIAKTIAKILRLHHQKHDFGTVCTPSPKQSDWEVAQEKLIKEIENNYKTSLFEINFQVSDSVCILIWGIVVLADWLTSGEMATEVENLFRSKLLPLKEFEQLFQLSSLRPVQKKAVDIWKTVNKKKVSAVIIEAPMGEGKTETALFIATQLLHQEGKQGIYVALPTTATARQMEERVSNLLKENSISPARLVHADAWLERDIKHSEEMDVSWFAPAKRSLLSIYAVGTIDQAMMAVLKIKHGVLRLLGLSSKVLIIDEMHAYDSYMQIIIFRLLEWCAALTIPVIILSATLPNERKTKLLKTYGLINKITSDSYPMITLIEKNSRALEIPVYGAYMTREILIDKVVFKDYENVASLALKAVQKGGCVCIIMNAVKDAQSVYREVCERSEKGIKVLLFHSKFLKKDRVRIEKECLSYFSKNASRPSKAILVATQIVEQSLDLDFDYMISAIAPIDLLLQRSGRLHRHSRKRPIDLEKPLLTILINSSLEQGAGMGRVYDPWIIRQTQKVVSDVNSFSIPKDVRGLIEAVYSETPSAGNMDDSNFNKWIEMKSREELLEGQAKSVVYPKPEDDWFFPLETYDFYDELSEELVCSDALTRLGSNNFELALIPASEMNAEKLKNPSKSLAREVMDLVVSISMPRGSEGIDITEDIVECGGYLRGVYAMSSTSQFSLDFVFGNKKIRKNYKICCEYGLQEKNEK